MSPTPDTDEPVVEGKPGNMLSGSPYGWVKQSEEYAQSGGGRCLLRGDRTPFSTPDDVQLRSPSVAPSLRAQLCAEIGRALRGDACGPELQPELEPVVKPKGSGCRRPVISEASHRHLRED
jgi:hypothetical protein